MPRSTVSRIKDPNAPPDSFVVQTLDGTRIAIKNAWYNRAVQDIENAAEESRGGRLVQISYSDYIKENPWAVLVFPLLWEEMEENVDTYTDYDPFDADNCSSDIEDIAIRMISNYRKTRMV